MKSASLRVEDDSLDNSLNDRPVDILEDWSEDRRLSRSDDLVSIETLETILGPGNYKSLSRLSKPPVSSTHVSRVLRGKIGASFDVAQRIADAAGITVHDLRRYIEATKRNGNSQ